MLVKLGTDYFNTDQSGFSDVLGKSFGNGLGSVLSGHAVIGGLGKSLGMPIPATGSGG
jgi:hypothetical protein